MQSCFARKGENSPFFKGDFRAKKNPAKLNLQDFGNIYFRMII